MKRFWAWVLGIVTTVVASVAIYYLTQGRQETANAIREIADVVLDLWTQTWFRAAALAVGCFVAGFCLGWFLRGLDRSRAEKRKALGYEMLKLGRNLGDYFGRIDGDPMNAFRPQIMSCFTTAKRLGMWTPDDRIFSIHPPHAMDLTVDYLTKVGTMLNDGHFGEASGMPRKVKPTSIRRLRLGKRSQLRYG